MLSGCTASTTPPAGEVQGAWMAKGLAHHGYQISARSLYPTLHQMETEGLIRWPSIPLTLA